MADLYEQITDRIIEQLTKGVVPWKSPYFSKTGFPRNFVSQKEYQGINVLLLGSQRFTSPDFLTFLQAKELGGNVRKGERGFLVVKYGTYSKEDEQAQEGDAAKQRGFLKGYTVFHSSQIDGIKFPEPVAVPELTTTEKTDRARAIVEAMPQRPPISEGSAVPCYRKHSDSIHMPNIGYFTNEEAYYSTLFHELGHAINKPGESNVALDKLNAMCWVHFRSLGFDCMADLFEEVAPKCNDELTIKCWSEAEIKALPWTLKIRCRPFHLAEHFAHLEIHHDGPLRHK